MRSFLPALAPAALLAVLSASATAQAFCGFYVAGADKKMFADATSVVLMRDGTRTVLSMQNDYQGPPEAFALVIPVPVVLQRENVKTLPREVFDRIDQLDAPRLVEYWEQDPCNNAGVGLGNIGTLGGMGFGSGGGRLGGAHAEVVVEAKFAVGEYEIVVLSSKDSGALEAWLRAEKYRIPDGAEAALKPYVEAGMFFFVARVDPSKVRFEEGRARLSPLRFHYDSPTFSLPVRLGLLNSSGQQDLIIHTLARGQRYDVANYPHATIPTNLDVTDATRSDFGAFYASLFDATVAKYKGAVVTEYSWDAGSCDPCPVPSLSAQELLTLGADVLPSTGGEAKAGVGAGVRLGTVKATGLPGEVVARITRQNVGRLRLCWEGYLAKNPDAPDLSLEAKLSIGNDGGVIVGPVTGGSAKEREVTSCVERGLHGLSFPSPEGGKGSAVVPIKLTKLGNAPPTGKLGGFVLTRLHARYGKEALGEDLVFREAPAISGGRERRGALGLEQGASPALANNFQGRYAIRHEWTGAVACDKPVRGIWGSKPKGDAPEPSPVAARNTAYAKRGATLADFVRAGASGDLLPSPSAAPPPSALPGPSAQPAPNDGSALGPGAAGCSNGCAITAGEGVSPAGLASAFALCALARRRRRRGLT